MKKYLMIKMEIEQLIMEIGAGNAIPSERQLAETYKTTRSTIRQAIDELVQDGKVYRTIGRKGTIVSHDNLIMTNNRLQGFYAEIKAKGLEPSSKILEKTCIKANPELVKKLNISDMDEVILLKRLRLVNDLPVSIEISYMPNHLFPELVETEPTPPSMYAYIEDLGYTIKSSHQIVRAITSPEAFLEDLGVGKYEPVIYIENIGLLNSGEIFEYGKTYQIGKHYQFEYTSVR